MLYPLEVTKTKVPRLVIFLHVQLGLDSKDERGHSISKWITGLIKAYYGDENHQSRDSQAIPSGKPTVGD